MSHRPARISTLYILLYAYSCWNAQLRQIKRNVEPSPLGGSTGPRWKDVRFYFQRTHFFSWQNEASFNRHQYWHLADDGSPLMRCTSRDRNAILSKLLVENELKGTTWCCWVTAPQISTTGWYMCRLIKHASSSFTKAISKTQTLATCLLQ